MNYKEYLTSIGFSKTQVEKMLEIERIRIKRDRALGMRIAKMKQAVQQIIENRGEENNEQ